MGQGGCGISGLQFAASETPTKVHLTTTQDLTTSPYVRPISNHIMSSGLLFLLRRKLALFYPGARGGKKKQKKFRRLTPDDSASVSKHIHIPPTPALCLIWIPSPPSRGTPTRPRSTPFAITSPIVSPITPKLCSVLVFFIQCEIGGFMRRGACRTGPSHTYATWMLPTVTFYRGKSPEPRFA